MTDSLDRMSVMEPLSYHALKDPDSDWARQAFALYEQSFPVEERDPIEVLEDEIRTPERADGVWFRFLLAVRGKDVVGISVYTYHPEARMGYLWYMAILEGVRGQGLGAQVLEHTVADLERMVWHRRLPSPVALCWEVERPEDAKDEDDARDRWRRIRFYEGNGARLVKGSALHTPPVAPGLPGVVYHLMYRPFSPNAAPPGAALVGALVDLILLNYEVDPQSADYQQSHASVGVRIRHAEKLDKAILQHFGAALAQLKSRSPFDAENGFGNELRSDQPGCWWVVKPLRGTPRP